MTGFGKAQAEYEGKKISVETRSLNSKQADISLRLPAIYKEKELILRQIISKKMVRGKIELSLWIEGNDADKKSKINGAAVREYYRQLQQIAEEMDYTIGNEQMLQTIMRIPDVMKTERPELDKKEWELVLETSQKAIEELMSFRAQEGAALEKDLRRRIELIRSYLVEIVPYETKRIETIRTRMHNNLEEYVNKKSMDENRFEQEIIFYIEKLDITEEKVRLVNHCAYFEETCDTTQAAGKKLGFISQEIGREINTIGSKANHAEIQKKVVQMKDELEKIKEQLLNIL